MRVLVDFMNLLHPWLQGAGGDLPLPPDDLPGQVNLLGRILAANGFDDPGTVIVCDGAMPAGWAGSAGSRIRVRFAGGGREADEVLEELIGSDTGPRHLLVVSSDRRVQRAAQRRRARVASAEAFLARLRVPGPAPGERLVPPTSLSADEVDAWLKAFGLD